MKFLEKMQRRKALRTRLVIMNDIVTKAWVKKVIWELKQKNFRKIKWAPYVRYKQKRNNYAPRSKA